MTLRLQKKSSRLYDQWCWSSRAQTQVSIRRLFRSGSLQSVDGYITGCCTARDSSQWMCSARKKLYSMVCFPLDGSPSCSYAEQNQWDTATPYCGRKWILMTLVSSFQPFFPAQISLEGWIGKQARFVRTISKLCPFIHFFDCWLFRQCTIWLYQHHFNFSSSNLIIVDVPNNTVEKPFRLRKTHVGNLILVWSDWASNCSSMNKNTKSCLWNPPVSHDR